MKILVTESQLRNLIYRQKKKRKEEVDEVDTLTTASSSSSAPTASTTTSSTGVSGGDDNGKSMSASEYPPYPEVGHWESGINRGSANQISSKSKWSEVVGSKITRGHANPLK